ncbi:TetR/AcrR family transcriptional regulator [Streptomyces sp. NPDC002643]
MKTRPYHHGDLRAALLDRAEETLRDKGPGGLSLRELAREVGVSPGAPSHHFKTKRALLDALALEGFDRLLAVLTRALEQADESFAGRLTSVARAYVAFATDNGALLELTYAAKYRPAAGKELIAATRRLWALTADLIQGGQGRGEVREGSVDHLMVPIVAVLQGFVTLVVSGAITADRIEQSLDDSVAVILRGCAP